jgi:FKBP-type peptidyl-prolyl cis-trans isomerase (trigger factor)
VNETTNTLDVSVEQPGGLERTMTVRVPSVEIEKEISVRLMRVGRTARIKGFRPGKVPPNVVRQRYGDQVRQEVISDVIRSSFSQALQQENLAPAGGPAIEPVTGEDEDLFAYKATFEVYPEVELGPLDGLRSARRRSKAVRAATYRSSSVPGRSSRISRRLSMACGPANRKPRRSGFQRIIL